MWSILIFIVIITYTNAEQPLTDDDIKVKFTKYVMTCSKTHPVDMTELMALQTLTPPKSKELKCLLACAYKADGMMNDKGMYDKDHVYKEAELLKGGDNDTRYNNGKKLADICEKVNEETVSDGENGCDRAALIFKCVAANAAKLGFKLT